MKIILIHFQNNPIKHFTKNTAKCNRPIVSTVIKKFSFISRDWYQFRKSELLWCITILKHFRKKIARCLYNSGGALMI